MILVIFWWFIFIFSSLIFLMWCFSGEKKSEVDSQLLNEHTIVAANNIIRNNQ